MSSKDLILHLGMPKTGTSFLQEDVFPTIPGLQVYRGWNNFRMLMDTPLDKKVLISDEYFSCKMTRGSLFLQFQERVQTIKKVFGDPLIVIGFRKPQEFVLSFYKQLLHAGLYYEWKDIFNSDNKGLIKFDDLDYTKYVELLQQNFSEVLIYSNEMLKHDLQKFMDRFTTFANLPKKDVEAQMGKVRNQGIKTIKQFEYLKGENLRRQKKGDELLFRLNRRFNPFFIKNPTKHAFSIKQTGNDELFTLPKDLFKYIDDLHGKIWEKFNCE